MCPNIMVTDAQLQAGYDWIAAARPSERTLMHQPDLAGFIRAVRAVYVAQRHHEESGPPDGKKARSTR